MTEPRRLLEDGTPYERDLLESAMLDAPSAARRRRLIASAAAASTALTATSASGAIAAWKIIVSVLAVGSLTAVAVRPRDKVAVVDPQPSAIVRAPRSFPSIVASDLAPVSVKPLPSVVIAPSASKPAFAPTTTTAGPSLSREVVWIDAARTALDAHDGPAALRALDGYDRECSGGSLVIEAAALRVEATALAGDPARASTLARAFLAAHPNSSYASRVGKYVTKP